jgi:O-antigen/teichoic acid export membrane protein
MGYLLNKKRIALTLLMAFLSEIANKVVPLVTLHIVAERLGVAAFGLAQYSLWFLEWGIVLTTFGFPQVAPVLLKQAKDPADQKLINGSIVIARLLLASVAALILLTIVGTQNSLASYRTAIFSSLFILLASALDSTWILVAKQKLAVFSLISMVTKVLSIAAILAFIQTPEDVVNFVVITTLINAIIAVSSFIVGVRLIGFSTPKWAQVRSSLIAASPFALAVVMFVILDRFDLYLVEKYFGVMPTGLYSAASKLVGSITPIIAAVSGVFYSEMLAQSDSESVERLVKASLFWIMSILSPVIFLLNLFDIAALNLIFGSAFSEASDILSILGIGTFFFTAIFVFGFQLLAIKQKWLPLVVALTIGVTCGLVFGYVSSIMKILPAVAVSAVAGKAVAGSCLSVWAKHAWGIRFRGVIREVLRALLPTILLGIFILIAHAIGISFSWTVALNVFVFCVCYVVIFSTLNLSEVKGIISYVRRKLVR